MTARLGPPVTAHTCGMGMEGGWSRVRAGTGEDVDHFLINSFVHLLGEMGRWDGGDLWLLLTAVVCSLYPGDPPPPPLAL